MKLKHIKEFGTKDVGKGFNGSQAPLVDSDLNIWATTRDSRNRSHPIRLGTLVSHEGLTFTLTQEDRVYSDLLGPRGSAWSNGVMLSQVCLDTGLVSMVGWTKGGDDESTSRNCLLTSQLYNGLNISNADTKVSLYTDDRCIGCSMAFYHRGVCYYMSFQGWYNKEALYCIRSCNYYNDGSEDEFNIRYYNHGDILSGGFCYARPVITERNDKTELWYCYREFGKRNYKAGCLELINNIWFPKSIETDEEIVAYPYPFQYKDKTYVLYNNDKSLRGNIQLAEVIDG